MHLLCCLLLLFQSPSEVNQALTPGAVRSESGSYKIAPGRLLTLKVTSVAGKPVKWFAASTDVDLVPWPNGEQAIFCSVKPGVYRLAAWSADKDGNPTEATVIVVTVEGVSPVVPPDDPKPPPTPNDPLASSLRGIYGGLQEQNKAANVATLAAIYRQSAGMVNQHATAGEFYGMIQRAAAAALGNQAIRPIRERIAEEFNGTLGTDAGQAMTEQYRAKVKAEFARVATILEGLTK